MTAVLKPPLFHALFFCFSYFAVCFAVDKVADGIALSKGITRNLGAPWYFRLLVGAVVGICSQVFFSVLQPAISEMLARLIAIAIGATCLGFCAGRQVTWINKVKAIIFTGSLSILGAFSVNIYGPSIGRFVVAAMVGIAISLALEIPDCLNASTTEPKPKLRTKASRSPKPTIETPPDRLVEPPGQIEVDAVKQPEIRIRHLHDLKTNLANQTTWILVFIATFFLSGCSARLVTYDGHSPIPFGSLNVLSKVVGSDQSKGRFRIGKSLKSGENTLVLYDNQNQGGNWFPSTGDEVVVEGQKSNATAPTIEAKTVRLCTTAERIQAVIISSWPYLIAIPMLLAGLVKFVIGPTSPTVTPHRKSPRLSPKTMPSPGSFVVVDGLAELEVPLPTHTSGLIVLGRDKKTCVSLGYDNYVILDNEAIDPVHAEIRFRPDRDAWYIVGGVTCFETTLDGEPVRPRVGKRLKPGSILDIGSGKVVLEWSPNIVSNEVST